MHRRFLQLHNQTKKNQSHRHAILLDTRQVQTKTIQGHMAPRRHKLCRLLHKAPSNRTSYHQQGRIPTALLNNKVTNTSYLQGCVDTALGTHPVMWRASQGASQPRACITITDSTRRQHARRTQFSDRVESPHNFRYLTFTTPTLLLCTSSPFSRGI